MPTAASSATSLLELDSVCRTFTLGEVLVPVLREMSFEVLRGEFLAIVGPSGSGKTTVLNLIGGLDRADRGAVLYRRPGQPPLDLSHATNSQLTQYRRHDVGFVFQFYNLVPNLTAVENVLVAAELVPDALDAAEVLRLVGLADRGEHFPSQLSGGEQQRVAIARAVAKNPELLLCDEPTGALDSQTGRHVLRLLVDLNRQLGKTVIVITHNAALAAVADRVIHLSSGRVADVAVNAAPRAPEEVVW